ncbi:hypothetical protein CMUST_02280 [Corynebacterium mustelae]|uniref:Secreted protein n=1 Tax=Corynebacterium mustelae TaxID=571915 RepID=A0A0G3GW98_9CORY|nr:hypothetical protein [Corynebacterium mustelae]AKK04800.1 hypothetical protein CMUST_02280 [Corynebacterium mustelae]
MYRRLLSCCAATILTLTTVVPVAQPQHNAVAATLAQTSPSEKQAQGNDFDLGTIISIVISVIGSVALSLIGLVPLLNYYAQKHNWLR